MNDVISGSDAERILRGWIAAHSGKSSKELCNSTSLVGGSFLDSFALVLLTMKVEEMLSRKLTQDESDIRHFTSLDAILATFFSEENRKGVERQTATSQGQQNDR
jgi:hypothetical protein